ncbi:MAG TPA: heavy metal-responsive transcriptional regulator [Woeseiaceae bacterium]|nr:heavy metal-responsive transcriptional regulator [Woeseiaceae bacterium]
MTMTIGRVAERTGVNIDTVRFYERTGLLPKPARRPSGYRDYGQGDLERLLFIRRAKELGFSLADIGELLSLSANRRKDMRGVKRKAEQRLQQVAEKISELQRVRRGLKDLIDACPGRGELKVCPIVAALSGENRRSDQ